MDRRPVVKARAHHGAPSLDLTIPAELRKALGLEPGDIFVVSGSKKDGKIVVSYTRIYPEE